MTKVPGVSVQLGAEIYILPPLNFDALETLDNDFRLLGQVGQFPTPDERAALVRIVYAALVRNYPEMTIADVRSRLDMGNMLTVIAAVTGVSGLERVSPGE